MNGDDLFGPLSRDDIERAARSMIRDYGARAAQRAATEAVGASARGSRLIAEYWNRIERRIREIQA